MKILNATEQFPIWKNFYNHFYDKNRHERFIDIDNLLEAALQEHHAKLGVAKDNSWLAIFEKDDDYLMFVLKWS